MGHPFVPSLKFPLALRANRERSRFGRSDVTGIWLRRRGCALAKGIASVRRVVDVNKHCLRLGDVRCRDRRGKLLTTDERRRQGRAVPCHDRVAVEITAIYGQNQISASRSRTGRRDRSERRRRSTGTGDDREQEHR
jgi:hypothetical protein